TTDPMVAAVDRLWDAGFVVVVAAGNSGLWGNMTINSPGNSRKAITVGSISDRGTGHNFSDDRRSSFSSRGPSAGDHVLKPDLMAPGNRVVAAVDGNSQLARWLWWRKRACDRYCAGTYLEMSGTSMAAPMVAAAAALMLEKEPHLSPDTIKARLMRSARRVNDDLTSVGAGTLDIMAAMTQTGVMHRPALSPLVQQSTSGALLIESTAALWGHPHWSNASLYHGSSSWNAAGGNTGTISGVSANGYLWTDETVSARGYLWTDEVFARGYLWTDEETVRARSLLSVDENGNVIMNDDP
ncbi:MAG: S8 family serine peptidase, partial [Pseudomonadota bacterium]